MVAGPAAALAAATLLVYALKPIAPVLSLGVVYTLAVLATAVLLGPRTRRRRSRSRRWSRSTSSSCRPCTRSRSPTAATGQRSPCTWSTAVVASELATRARRRAAEAEQREREAALLADAAAALLQEAPLDEIRSRAERVLGVGDTVARDALRGGRRRRCSSVADERRSAEAVRRSDAIKTIILHTVSHDFRTPLATMRAAIDGLESTDLALTNDDRADLLETIRIEVARLSAAGRERARPSRLQAGAAAPQRELWAVDDLLEQAVAESSGRGACPPRDRDRVCRRSMSTRCRFSARS